MKKTAALELRNVSYVANGKTILDGINWTVQHGEHWAILGPNGSGKTTLLKLASGYLWPNAGGVVLRKGKELTHLPELRKSIGWVTAALVSEIPAREKVLNTVVSGKFAQIGYLGGIWGQASSYDYVCARRHLKELWLPSPPRTGIRHTVPRRAAESFDRAGAHDEALSHHSR